MAYKNKKKNKTHQSEIRKANSSKKHQREYRRNHKDDKPPTLQDFENIMRTEGLI
jgi:hypothetical protein